MPNTEFPQERQVVGCHLANAYGKLGVTSRGELPGLGITG